MEYRGFHLQHEHQEEYTTTSVNQSLYKPFTPQAWNSSNNMYCSSNINSRDFDFERHRTVKDENHDSVILSSISSEGEVEYYSQSQQYCDTSDHNHVQKAIVRDGERGILALPLSNKRYYNFNNAGGASSLSSCSSLNQYLSTTLGMIMPPSSLLLSSSNCDVGLNSQMLLGESATTATCGQLLQLSYDSFALNQHHDTISLSYMRQNNTPSNTSNQGPALISGVARTKTPRKYCPQPKGFSETNPNKKSRPASCSPLQVRKEKLGDRIQTLQKLVAPFGKTNTASVLTEAIGYIHFLHDQIQTLSVPYMKSSQTRPFTMVQLDSKEEDSRKFNFKPDLRSRGLCLVPISYASYIHNFD